MNSAASPGTHVDRFPGDVARGGEIVVHADAAGAAYLMKELLALGCLDAALGEENGRWRVVVRAGEAIEPSLSRIVDCLESCAGQQHLAYATLSVGGRSFTVYDPVVGPGALGSFGRNSGQRTAA